MNSNGGFLMIGVNDDRTIQGLSYDFSLAPGNKDQHDFFRVEFDRMLKKFIPKFIIDKISGDFYKINGADIFVITVFPSQSKPIFLYNGEYGKEFWVRWNASTIPYTDIEEICGYVLEHWNTKDQSTK